MDTELPGFRQLVYDVAPRNDARAQFPAICVWIYIALVADLERVTRILPQVHIPVHHFFQFLDILDPLVVNYIGEPFVCVSAKHDMTAALPHLHEAKALEPTHGIFAGNSRQFSHSPPHQRS